MGPVELIVVSFPGNQFKGEIIPALRDIVDKGLIRIIDLVFIRKEADGAYRSIELAEVDDAARGLDPITDEVNGMLSPDDIAKVADLLDPNSSAGLMLFEHTWAANFAAAVRNANGELVFNERIPAETVEAALAAVAE